MAKKKSGGKKRKSGKRKMSGAAKKAFLERMKKGRSKAKRSKTERRSRKRRAARSKPSTAKRTVRRRRARRAPEAAPRKRRKARKTTTTRRHKRRASAAPSRARSRARSKKQLSTRGTVVIGGKPQPINMRVNVGEGRARARSGRRTRSRSRRHYHSNPMVSRVTSVYENPMTAKEFAVGAVLAAVGMIGGRALDRYLATRPYMASIDPNNANKPTTALDPTSAVNSAPGIMRVGAQLVLAAVPLIGSYWAGPTVRAGLQGFSIGVGANLVTSLVEHYVLVKFFAPKDTSAAYVPSTTAPTLMQRLYNDELSADMGRAAVVASGGAVAGLPGQRAGVGARRIPQGRMIDPGPRATARAGVGECGDGGGMSSQPGCIVDPTCGTPAATSTDASNIVSQAQAQSMIESSASPTNTQVAPPANGTMSGLGAFPWMRDSAEAAE